MPSFPSQSWGSQGTWSGLQSPRVGCRQGLQGRLSGRQPHGAWSPHMGIYFDCYSSVFSTASCSKFFFSTQETDLSIFDLIGLENKMTRHEAELLCKKKVTRKLIEELFAAPPPSSRPVAIRLKPSRYVVRSITSCSPWLWLGPGWL